MLMPTLHEDCPKALLPVGYKLLIEILPDEEMALKKQDSVIDIPEEIQDKYSAAHQRGRILGIGPLAWKAHKGAEGAPWAELGDYIWIKKYVGQNLKREGRQFRFIDDEEFYGVDRSMIDD